MLRNSKTTPSMAMKPGILSPNLFVLGAGKCGTTSLHQVLAEHPLIHMSAIKEPSFFCSYFQVVKNPIDYFALFQTTRAVAYRGESSHVYFSNPETAAVLRGLFPDARFILILRDPAKRAYSLFRHMRTHNLESEPSFHRALLLEPERRTFNYTRFPHYPWNFFYIDSSRYDVQFARYLEYFPRRQFVVVSLAELVKEPQHTLRRIFDFLELPMGEGMALPHLNSGGTFSPIDVATSAVLSSALEGVTDRLEAFAEQKLDWSI